MNLIKSYCSFKYYNRFNSDSFLEELKTNVIPKINNLSKDFQFTLHKIVNSTYYPYLNKKVFDQTNLLLEKLINNQNNPLVVDDTVFNYYLMGYNSYFQLTETISDFKNFNISEETKTRLYRLPTYTTLVEGCLSNFLRVISVLTGNSVGKDYSKQTTLGQLINVIKSNGYNEISENIDVNIRNSINHGKILTRNSQFKEIVFYYSENNTPKSKVLKTYEFDNLIDKTLDIVSGVFLAISLFMNNNIDLIKINDTKNKYVSFSHFAMCLSLPEIHCYNISDIENSKQLNIEMKIDNTDRDFIGELAIMLSIIIFDKYNYYKKYMISFNNPHMMTGWVIFENQDISDMINSNKSPDTVISEIIVRKDFQIFDSFNEKVDMNEIKYFVFPNYIDDMFKINSIKDASLINRKRLNTNLYIGDIDNREDILSIIDKSIEWLKTVENPPCPTYKIKHGNIPADSLYINVYRKDDRGNKELFVNNENFVCFVDYNIDGVTTLKNGGIFENLWKQFKHEKIGNLLIAWRNGKYFTQQVNKIGRNKPCPCGSSKKYKKCCGA